MPLHRNIYKEGIHDNTFSNIYIQNLFKFSCLFLCVNKIKQNIRKFYKELLCFLEGNIKATKYTRLKKMLHLNSDNHCSGKESVFLTVF